MFWQGAVTCAVPGVVALPASEAHRVWPVVPVVVDFSPVLRGPLLVVRVTVSPAFWFLGVLFGSR